MNIQTKIAKADKFPAFPLGGEKQSVGEFWVKWAQVVAEAQKAAEKQKDLSGQRPLSGFVIDQRTISMGRTHIKLNVLSFIYFNDEGKPAKPGQKRSPKSYRGARRNEARKAYRKQKHQ